MRLVILLLIILLHHRGSSQTNWMDSVRRLAENGRLDTLSAINYNELAQAFLNLNHLDSSLANAGRAYSISTDRLFHRGQIESILIKSKTYTKSGDYARALETALDALKIAEHNKDREAVLVCYERLYQLFFASKNYEEALMVTNKMKNEFKDIFPDTTLLLNISLFREDWRPQNFFYLSRLGMLYHESNMPDSALKYAQQAFEYSVTKFGPDAGDYVTSFLTGRIHAKMKNYTIALPFLHSSLDKSLFSGDSAVTMLIMTELARLYEQTHEIDSAIFYATKGYIIADQSFIKRSQIELSELLASLYADRDNDKAVSYFKIADALRDTVYAEDRVNAMQKEIFAERMRQDKLEAERDQQEHQRLQNLEFAAIGIGLIVFSILFFLLSRSIIVNETIIRFLSIMGLLVTFEFINLLIHPFLEQVMHHKPLWMLISLVALAALLVPLHHKIEKWVIWRLVEKNKKIRLANAQKVIRSSTE